MSASGGAAQGVALDVASPTSVKAALAIPFDIVVNNAGVTASEPALDMADGAFERIVETNLNGVFHVAREAARAMRATGRPGRSSISPPYWGCAWPTTFPPMLHRKQPSSN